MNQNLEKFLAKSEFFAKEYNFKILILNLFGKLQIYNINQFNPRTDANMQTRDFLEFSGNNITEFFENVTIPIDMNRNFNADFNKKIEKNFLNVESFLYKVNRNIEYIFICK